MEKTQLVSEFLKMLTEFDADGVCKIQIERENYQARKTEDRDVFCVTITNHINVMWQIRFTPEVLKHSTPETCSTILRAKFEEAFKALKVRSIYNPPLPDGNQEPT